MKKNSMFTIRLICLIGIWVFGNYSLIKAQSKGDILKNIERHEKAVHVLQEDISNPFIQLAPDGYYYLTGTVPMDLSSNKKPFVKFWRSTDLVNWEDIGKVEHAEKSVFVKELRDVAGKRKIEPKIGSTEAHYINNRWVIVHTSNVLVANLMLSESQNIKSSYTEPLGLDIGFQADPTIFVDTDGTPWLLSNCTQIRKIKKDFSGFDGNHRLIGPKNRQLGFEGTRMVKAANKYVLFGTGWSTDIKGRGTYNLYYSTADNILGPYSPRKFAGRFLGNGAPFQDKNGRWWSLAFYNAKHPTMTLTELNKKDVSDSAYTINKPGVTLVPLNVEIINGEISITAKDPDYRSPGKEEVQQF